MSAHPKVFISHASEDKERFVVDLATKLRQWGIDAWLDQWEIQPGDSLVEKIFQEGIGNSQAVIIVLSEHSVQKLWVRQELNASVIRHINKEIRLIPVIIGPCQVPFGLLDTYHIKVEDLSNYDDELQRLVRTIYGIQEKPPLGTPLRMVYDNTPALQSDIAPLEDMSRLTDMREKYQAYLLARYQQTDLRGIIPVEHVGLHTMRVLLHELYVPLNATLTQHSARSVSHSLPVYLSSSRRVRKGQRSPRAESGPHLSRIISSPSSRKPPTSAMRSTNAIRREHIPLETLVTDNPIMVILGDPGSGKTTFLKYHALGLLTQDTQAIHETEGGSEPGSGRRQDNQPLPILVPLAAYAQSLKDRATLSIQTYAAEFYRAHGLPDLQPLFHYSHSKGNTVYLLDGLDEVPADMRIQVANMVVATANSLGSNRLVVTSRVAGYIPLALTTYSEATLEPFTQAQIALYIHNWYDTFYTRRNLPADPTKTATQLLDAINHNQGITKLADNPLTLTMLSLLFYAGHADLPRYRVTLYRQVVNTLTAEWRKARNLAGIPIGSSHPELEVLKQLGPLAYWMHDQKPDGLADRVEVEHLLARLEREANPEGGPDTMPGVRRFLDELSKEVGILSERGPGQWAFTHLTFQEYFAAREIARWRQPRVEAEVAQRVRDAHWSEVIQLAVAYIGRESGRTEDATALVEEVILQRAAEADAYEPYLHRHLLFAGRVIADEPGVERRVAVGVARRLFDLLMKTRVDRLVESTGTILLQMLATELRSTILDWIGKALRTKHSTWRLRPLAKAPEVRGELLQQLKATNLRSGLNIEDIVEALRDVADDPAVYNAILPLLTPRKRSETVVVAALRTLANAISEQPVRDQVISKLSHRNPYIRRTAVGALGPVVQEQAVCATLIPLLADSNAGVQKEAIRVLCSVPTVVQAHNILPTLLSLLNDPDPKVRTIAEVMGNAAELPAIRTALLDLLTDSHADVRAAATRGLGSLIHNPTVRAALTPLLTDPEWGVQAEAARILAVPTPDPPTSLLFALALLNDEDAADDVLDLWLANAPWDPYLFELARSMFDDPYGYGADTAFAAMTRWSNEAPGSQDALSAQGQV
ncbi:MAG TPA: TIR domain-containing protein [Chloroflexia bacterium]